VFLFDKKNPSKTLLQQRAAGKYHCPLMWANACCSHPRENEPPADGARRRIQEELGIKVEALVPAGSFIYRAPVGDLIEHELDHVFAGLWQESEVPFNPQEVAQIEWVDLNDFLSMPRRKIVPWFEAALYKALAVGLDPVHLEILKQEKKKVAA
jgi:isopentenyl-diphosphate delta-isomerase